MLLSHRAAYEGVLPPRFYGLAYPHPDMRASVYYLIPFNLFVRWWRGFWYWLVAGRGNRWERALGTAYSAGARRHIEQWDRERAENAEWARRQYFLGFDEGKKAAIDVMKEQFEKDLGRPL